VQTQLQGATQFAHVLEALRRQGAGPDLVAEIAGMGEQSLQFAQQLLQLGPEQIRAIDKQYEAILDLQRKTAAGLSERYFGERIDHLQQLLHTTNEWLQFIARRLERALERRENAVNAQRGFHGTIARDTLFRAHAGERVDIGRSGSTVHLHFHGPVGVDNVVDLVRRKLHEVGVDNVTAGIP